MKIVISDPKSGKAYQVEKDLPVLNGMKIGEKLDGSLVDLRGYSLQITGGSDNEGFPMKSDLPGTGRRRLLLNGGVGYRNSESGRRVRKSVRGRVISDAVVQLNVKIVEHGKDSIEKLLGLEPEEAPAEETVEEKTETPTEEPAKEEPQEEVAEETADEPSEEATEEAEETVEEAAEEEASEEDEDSGEKN